MIAALALGTVVVGIAVVMATALEPTRLTLLLASFVVCVGLFLMTAGRFFDRVSRSSPVPWARVEATFVGAAIVFSSLGFFALLRMTYLTRRRAHVVRLCGWLGCALGAWFAIAGALWPADLFDDYMLSLGRSDTLSRPGFWLFASIFIAVTPIYFTAWGLLALGGAEPAETRRAGAFVIASGLVIAATAAPPMLAGFLIAAWISLGVYGQMQYASARAARGVFLSRFLSPRVAEKVDSRGLAETMKPRQAEVSVVCADLRGFTAYSEGVPSQAVVDLLAEYYDAVGKVVARHGGTITSYAGDGILVLVGAPLQDRQHASTAIEIARESIDAVWPVLERWQTRLHPLGIGVGVASGRITVGAISAETRMEYTAIGVAVNLAARLCARAASGEVLVDGEAALCSGARDLEARGQVEVKGFSSPQPVYAITGHRSP